MFFYKITERQKRGDTKTSRNTFHEFLHTSDLGSVVGTMMRTRSTTSVSVTKISQAHYVRATRGGE
jgi:hypothetical protein